MLVQQKVLWLEIPVNDVVPMAVLDSGDDLLEESARVALLQLQNAHISLAITYLQYNAGPSHYLAVLDNVVEELSATDVLHDHEDVGGRRDDLIQLDDVGVAEELQILDLPPDLSHHVQALNLLPIQDLDGDLVARHLMETHCEARRASTPRGSLQC